MRIRLHGTSAEIVGTLAETLDIHTASRPYPDRPPSTLTRVYLDAAPYQRKDCR